MRVTDDVGDQAVRERAYFLWQSEGRPKARAHAHWALAQAQQSGLDRAPEDGFKSDEERIVDGRPADLPAFLTKDVPGG